MLSNEAYLKEVNKYTKQMKKLAGQEVVVGIPTDANKNHVSDEGTMITLAQLGATHEYGAPDANIPQRSFLRIPLSKNSKEIFKVMEKDLKFSEINTDKALGKLGAKGQSIVLEAFSTQGNGKWEALRPDTIKNRKDKGVSGVSILRDTSQLMQGITFEVRDA